MKNKISKFLSVLLLITILFCEFMPNSAFAAKSVSKSIKLEGYGIGKASIKLSWKTEYDYDHFIIYRAKDKGSYKKITKVTTKKYTDKKLETESTYRYKVVGVDGKVKKESSKVKVNPMRRVSPYVNREDKSRVSVNWSYEKGQSTAITGFYVYRKAEGESSYKKLGSLSKKGYLYSEDGKYVYEFLDTTNKKVGKTYSYKVVPYRGSKKGCSKIAEITIEPHLYLSTAKKEIKINWTSYPKATTYKIYADIFKYDSEGYYEYYKTKKITTKQKGGSRSYTYSGVNTKKYMYIIYIEAYKKVKGKLEYLGTYPAESSESPYSLMRNAAAKKSNKKYSVVSYRGKKPTLAWTSGLSSSDKKIMSDFAKLHFQSGMSKTEKALYVQRWIHYNNNYDYSYTTSSNHTYVESIFENKKGQCLQYNGALVEYLNYLGFEARLIQGYRYQNASHYWGEIKINGRWYCMETGTFKKDGYWQHFCERYGGFGATNYNICGKIT